MRINSLALTNFRNFRATIIRPEAGVNIFFGDNGSGKSNLLEAIFALCLGRSQRGARDQMMVNSKGDGYFRLEGHGETAQGKVKITCAYETGGRKKITVDENPVRVSKLFRIFAAISMAPEDVALFSGPPSGRRRFLDLHLSQASPTYLADLSDYSKALAQKNSFLKNGNGQECPFDPLMIEIGSRIMAARHNFVEFLQGLAPGYYDRICGNNNEINGPAFGFEYQPNVPFTDKGSIADAFAARIEQKRKKESIIETAIVGPHRDDVDFIIRGFPARGYGSQGELRSGTIAVMLAAANYLEQRRKERPLLLLDEIFAELDDDRRNNLAAMFDEFEQIFLTTAVTPPEKLMQRGTVFHISKGSVEKG